MEAIIALIIIWAVWKLIGVALDSRANNYPIRKVDPGKMAIDKSKNNLSNKQVFRNMGRGKYDKD